MRKRFFSPLFLLLFGTTMLALAACGGGGSGDATSNSDNSAGVTAEVRPTIIPTYNFVLPTASPGGSTSSASTAEATTEATAEATAAASTTGPDPEKIALGQGRYTALECNTCHGEAGEGVTDKGPALTTFAMSEDEFITFMRSGGTMGPAHQFATNRLSITGGANLYQFMLSLVK